MASGPALLVGNHSGGNVAADALVFTLAFTGASVLSGAGWDSGAAVPVYPGGDWEAHRPSWHGHRIEFAGRKGFVRLALAADVPIVPVVSIGGQETALC